MTSQTRAAHQSNNFFLVQKCNSELVHEVHLGRFHLEVDTGVLYDQDPIGLECFTEKDELQITAIKSVVRVGNPNIHSSADCAGLSFPCISLNSYNTGVHCILPLINLRHSFRLFHSFIFSQDEQFCSPTLTSSTLLHAPSCSSAAILN